MCLITNTSIPTILDKDLVVYKVLEKKGRLLCSPYQRFTYKLRKTYHNKILKEYPSWRTNLSIGFYEGIVTEAFHSCLSIDRAKTYLECFSYIYKCIIPKGSKVFYDIDEPEIASDTIIIKRRLLFNRF